MGGDITPKIGCQSYCNRVVLLARLAQRYDGENCVGVESKWLAMRLQIGFTDGDFRARRFPSSILATKRHSCFVAVGQQFDGHRRAIVSRCRYVSAIQRALPRRCAGLDDREDRAAALLLCAFSEVAHMEDPREREDFVRGIWSAYHEFVPATIVPWKLRYPEPRQGSVSARRLWCYPGPGHSAANTHIVQVTSILVAATRPP
jgi:hypothetical protein